MREPTNSNQPWPLFNRIVVAVGSAGVAISGVVVALRGRIGDRRGWSMEAPVSAAIAGGLFAVAGLGLLLYALYGGRSRAATDGEEAHRRSHRVGDDSKGETKPPSATP